MGARADRLRQFLANIAEQHAPLFGVRRRSIGLLWRRSVRDHTRVVWVQPDTAIRDHSGWPSVSIGTSLAPDADGRARRAGPLGAHDVLTAPVIDQRRHIFSVDTFAADLLGAVRVWLTRTDLRHRRRVDVIDPNYAVTLVSGCVCELGEILRSSAGSWHHDQHGAPAFTPLSNTT